MNTHFLISLVSTIFYEIPRAVGESGKVISKEAGNLPSTSGYKAFLNITKTGVVHFFNKLSIILSKFI
ncbi:hypothetical protein NAI42_12995, partial [Francisella tularensis subsp. holarctica]|uniref:hypothetical protein n=1 Tax=Francisella tularensis TaxID=263 RepID=UPI002381A1FF